MALTLLFKRTLTSIGSLTIDCSVSESHQKRVEVTTHPVEDGSDPADHARVLPDVLVIQGIVTDTPHTEERAQQIDQDQGLVEGPLAERAGISLAAFNRLQQFADDRALLTIVTAARTYTDMLLEQLDVPKDATTGDALRFSATFKQVRRVKNQVTVVVTARDHRARSRSKLGRTTPKEASAEQVNQAKEVFGLEEGDLNPNGFWGETGSRIK